MTVASCGVSNRKTAEDGECRPELSHTQHNTAHKTQLLVERCLCHGVHSTLTRKMFKERSQEKIGHYQEYLRLVT